MQIPPAITPIVKGREQTGPGGHALAGASESDSNPNRRHAPSAPALFESGEEAKPKETPTSRLIDRSPISSETQAALLALLSEPFSEPEGGGSFAEHVEEATLEQSTAEEQSASDEADKSVDK